MTTPTDLPVKIDWDKVVSELTPLQVAYIYALVADQMRKDFYSLFRRDNGTSTY